MIRNDSEASTSPRRVLVCVCVLAAITAAAALSACNTTEGVGKDVKSLGKGVEESARDNK